MKGRYTSLREFAKSNVFDACSDALLADSVLDELALLKSRYHCFNVKDGVKSVILDKSAPDYEQMFIEKGQPLAADEMLENFKPLVLKIPLRSRSEFRSDQLPLSELLMAIQYYASHTSMRKYSMNETALLTLGMLVEQWANEMVDDDVARMFLELDDEGGNGDDLMSEKYAPISDAENERVMDHWKEEETDSDIMSVDLEESDTDAEVRELDKLLEGTHAVSTGSRRRRSLEDSSRMEVSDENANDSSDTSSGSSSESGSSEESSNEISDNDSSEEDVTGSPQSRRLSVSDSQSKLSDDLKSKSDLGPSDLAHSSLSDSDSFS